ncbi:MAG: hypothetical protein WAN40_04150 [Thermoplasmata archaeon]
MPESWRHSSAWVLVVLVAGVFALGVVLPLEVASYATGHQTVHPVESLESSFRISYLGQWSGFGAHWYNYSVNYGAAGLLWNDFWMTMYFNGTTNSIAGSDAYAVVNNNTVCEYKFLTGAWGPRAANASVLAGETLSFNLAEFSGDGNTLYVAAVQGGFYGSLSLVIP